MTEDTDFAAWIGRSDSPPAEAVSTPLIERFKAMLEPHLAVTDAVPAGLHWCLSPQVVRADGIGGDGHPRKGGFLPPIPLPRRMWAGGELEFLLPIRDGDLVTRRSRIADVKEKTGRSGALFFVTVAHEILTPEGTAIRERQDIVYRPAATGPAPAPAANARPDPDAEWRVDVDPVLLFRYSALTFNGHRIHYDEPYARQVEHYPGLVIHGPMQATLLLNLAIAQGGGVPRRFSFRGVSPACGPQVLRVRAWKSGNGLELATVTSSDVTAMEAVATW